ACRSTRRRRCFQACSARHSASVSSRSPADRTAMNSNRSAKTRSASARRRNGIGRGEASDLSPPPRFGEGAGGRGSSQHPRHNPCTQSSAFNFARVPRENIMLSNTNAVANLAVKDLEVAKQFYEGTLGLKPVAAEGHELVVYR